MNAVTKVEPLPPVESASLIAVIERAAVNPDVDIDKMERLMQMHERICAKQAETAFGAAMVEAQSEMRRIATDADNPQTRSKYASYAALDRALRPIYTSRGFAVSFDTGEPEQDAVNVVAYVSHTQGHTRTYHIKMPADGKGAKGGDVMTKTHAAGAAMSYGMRYLLKMIFNVAVGEDDDDGNLGAVQDGRSEKVMAELRRKHLDSVTYIKDALREDRMEDAAAAWFELPNEAKEALWTAPSRGGLFTTAEREIMKTKEFRLAGKGE